VNPLHHLKISQIRAFVTVADCGNFGAAALELDLSQSTVSHAIATLEADLGVVLLTRGRQGASLTAIGAEILPEAKQVLALLETMHHKAMHHKASLDKGLRILRIASVRSIATHLLPDAIVRFQQAFPAIEIVIRDCDYYLEVEQMLHSNQAEIGLTLLPPSGDFTVQELIQDEFVALLPAPDPKTAAPNPVLTWEQLLRYPMIMNPIAAPYIHTRTVQAHLARFGHQLPVAYEVKEDSTIIGMVKRGLGATVMARLAAEPIPAGVQLCQLPEPLVRSVGAIIRRDVLLPRAVFAFLEVLPRGEANS
jgi:DNA-binding transcriptional LysR family regulator